MRRVPRTHNGIPDGFYRADLIHPDQIVKGKSSTAEILGTPNTGGALDEEVLQLDERLLRVAYVPLCYDEGFPTLPDGQPFWAQLDFEPVHCYLAFQAYLEQGTRGTRQLGALVTDNDVQIRIASSRRGVSARSIVAKTSNEHTMRGVVTSPHIMLKSDALSTIEGGANSSDLQEWLVLYCWVARARAYDLFYVNSIRRSREMLSVTIENEHLLASTRLYQKLMLYIDPFDAHGQRREGVPTSFIDEDGESRFWKDVTPKSAIDLLKLTTQLQRLAVGLPAAAPSHQSSVLGKDTRRGAGTSSRTDDHDSGSAGEDVEQMSDEERVRRIGALLNQAAARRDAQQGEIVQESPLTLTPTPSTGEGE
jgi:hypothetical protein